MTYEPQKVVVTRYKAHDGTLHNTPQQAQAHDVYMWEQKFDGELDRLIGMDQELYVVPQDVKEDFRRFIVENWSSLSEVMTRRDNSKPERLGFTVAVS